MHKKKRTRKRKPGRPKINRWSVEWRQCVDCKTRDRHNPSTKHEGNGRCHRCYYRTKMQERRDAV